MEVMATKMSILDSSSPLNPMSNRTRKKSKNGCRTCKLRKIKCDETAPVCLHCVKYYSNTVPRCEYEQTSADTFRPSCDSENNSSSSSSDAMVIRKPKSSKLRSKPWNTFSFPRVQLGVQKFDPFETNLETKLPSADMLRSHYLTVFRKKCIPVGFKAESNPLTSAWWGFMQADPLLDNVAMQVAAVDIEWNMGVPNAYSSKAFAEESIRILKGRLDGSSSSISDETIAGVALLAVIEHGKRNMTAAKMHVEGVKRMVSLRGGLEKIRASSPSSATAIFWFTFVIMAEHQFPLSEEEREHCRLIDAKPYMGYRSPNEVNFSEFVDDKESLEVLSNTRNFCHSLSMVAQDNSLHTSGMNSIHSRFGSHLRCLLQKAPPGSRPPLTECCRYAASIFLFFAFENHFPDPTLLINTILHKLKTALSEILPCSPAQNTLAIWLLVVGGAASWKLPAERDWFLSFMIDLAVDLELSSWKGLKAEMRKVMWIEGMNESPFTQLWEEATMIADTQTTQVPFSQFRSLA